MARNSYCGNQRAVAEDRRVMRTMMDDKATVSVKGSKMTFSTAEVTQIYQRRGKRYHPEARHVVPGSLSANDMS